MKKWFFCVVLLGLLGYEWFHQGREAAVPELDGRPQRQVLTDKGAKNLTVLSKSQIHQGSLLLVNREYPIHKSGVSKDIVTLSERPELTQGYALLDNSTMLSEQVAEQFSKMVQAASGQGVRNFLISSGYRDNAKQQELFADKGADYALPPGHSEHNLGLSLDIGSSQMAMSRAPEGQWLREHAWDYGFILRYPEDKTDITGIKYEPWHFRYVGLPHSMIMRDNNFTLEEYLEFLKEQGVITTSAKGIEYKVSYFKITGNTPVPTPSGKHVEFSGNNIDGVIMTVYP
ncbi:M15 family metallopeptidase [Paenibacillus sp. MMS20-IR301]|uniref:M15 family metallopeptidase n=1 Tax=Paenibacillus sp. MMS20-IR301 TaxID=2895946 RepID=UPI0028EAB36A|nr:M15 family metallopeptidase [Paenibacillus sp. MMS20-IR301]WNS45880.1 M15 family metallopeptidase [Paenibacillus sp. MMS20-IR301]